MTQATNDTPPSVAATPEAVRFELGLRATLKRYAWVGLAFVVLVTGGLRAGEWIFHRAGDERAMQSDRDQLRKDVDELMAASDEQARAQNATAVRLATVDGKLDALGGKLDLLLSRRASSPVAAP